MQVAAYAGQLVHILVHMKKDTRETAGEIISSDKLRQSLGLM